MRLTIGFVALIVLYGCHRVPTGSSMDRAEAQKASDAFMADLVADHVDLALDKMEPEFIQEVGGKAVAEEKLRGLFSYCGRPLNSELRHDETGIFMYSDRHIPPTAPMRAFFYSAKTTQFEKGVCFFAVRIVPG